jgi:lysophospholipase L1-like esterase
LLQKFPDARIVILTPLHRLSENNTVKEVRNIPTLPLKAYVDAQRRIAEYYGLPIIDLYSISGLQPAVEEIRVKYMPDGLHPSDAGAKRLAEVIYAQLLAL